jgi:hypothetical protein
MKRHDYIRRLWDTIDAHRELPFQWGGRDTSHDCCTFVAACLDAMTGDGYLDRLLAHYQDEDGAKAFIAAHGGLEGALTATLGDPIRIAFMRRGDVVLIEREGKEFVGICTGELVFSAGPDGLVTNPRQYAIRAWSA